MVISWSNIVATLTCGTKVPKIAYSYGSLWFSNSFFFYRIDWTSSKKASISSFWFANSYWVLKNCFWILAVETCEVENDKYVLSLYSTSFISKFSCKISSITVSIDNFLLLECWYKKLFKFVYWHWKTAWPDLPKTQIVIFLGIQTYISSKIPTGFNLSRSQMTTFL